MHISLFVLLSRIKLTGNYLLIVILLKNIKINEINDKINFLFEKFIVNFYSGIKMISCGIHELENQ